MAYSDARDAQLPLRMSKNLKQMLQDEAKRNNRSVNAEVVLRLAQSFGEEVVAAEASCGPSVLQSMAADIKAIREMAVQFMWKNSGDE